MGRVEGHAQDVVNLPKFERRLTVQQEEVFRVGGREAADWSTFGTQLAVGFDGRGRLYVFDAQKGQVMVVDASGRLVRAFGRRGEGPGEFWIPVDFAVTADGTSIVHDVGHGSYLLFDAEGGYLRAVRESGGRGIRTEELIAERERLGGWVSRRQVRKGEGQAVGGTARDILWVDLEGEEVRYRHVAETWSPPPSKEGVLLQSGGIQIRGAMGLPRAFEPRLHLARLPSAGLAYVDSSTYRVRLVDSAGAKWREIVADVAPQRVTNDMKVAERKRRLDGLAAGGGEEGRGGRLGGLQPLRGLGGAGSGTLHALARQRIEQMGFYPEVPVISDMRSGWSGKLWIQRSGADGESRGPVDILTATGEYIGTVPREWADIPRAFGPEGMVAYVERDEFDVPTVVVKRLPVVLR